MPYRMFLFAVVCKNGCNTQAVACWLLLFSDNSITASRKPTSRAPCSGFSTVLMMDYAVRSCELRLERFASTTAIATNGSLRISVVWSRNHCLVKTIEQQALPNDCS